MPTISVDSDTERVTSAASVGSRMRARPKSITLTWFARVIRMLPGFRSRCTTFAAWAAPSASATSRAYATASAAGRTPRAMRSASGSPSTSSITRKSTPSIVSKSWTVAMAGWLSRDSDSASRRKRRRAASSASRPGPSTLMATSRSSRESWARQASPIPPAPIRPSTRYRPSSRSIRSIGLSCRISLHRAACRRARCYARRVRRSIPLAVLAVALLSLAAMAAPQRGFGFFRRRPLTVRPNIPYNGRFTFVRVRYQTAPGGFWYRGLPSWAHGYPFAERNLMRIMNEVSSLDAHDDAIDTVTLDDPELFKYPVAYLIEPSWWILTDREADGLRAYLQKGGFLIIDDFKATGDFGSPGWEPFAANIGRVLPGARFFEMKATDPIFHCFFEIDDLGIVPQAYNRGRPVFRGVYEDNDPRRRLQIIVNYNTDISQFWEWSGRGFRPISETNEAYKLGVNYLVYGLTH